MAFHSVTRLPRTLKNLLGLYLGFFFFNSFIHFNALKYICAHRVFLSITKCKHTIFLLVHYNCFKLTISLLGMTLWCYIINWHSGFDGLKLRSLVPGPESPQNPWSSWGIWSCGREEAPSGSAEFCSSLWHFNAILTVFCLPCCARVEGMEMDN